MKIEDVINRAVVIDNMEEEGSAIAKACQMLTFIPISYQ